MKVICSNCRKTLKAPVSSGGKKGRCPGCGEIFEIPSQKKDHAENQNAPPPISKCPFCGGEIRREALVCRHCGRSFIEEEQGEFSYAGFWKRFAASLIDGVITGAAIFLISLLTRGMNELVDLAVNILFGLFYNAGFESSARQATPGKMVLGIKVTDLRGRRVSFGRAAGRHFAQYISIFTFGIGYIMIAFTPRKQGLHDIIAGCLVINE